MEFLGSLSGKLCHFRRIENISSQSLLRESEFPHLRKHHATGSFRLAIDDEHIEVDVLQARQERAVILCSWLRFLVKDTLNSCWKIFLHRSENALAEIRVLGNDGYFCESTLAEVIRHGLPFEIITGVRTEDELSCQRHVGAGAHGRDQNNLCGFGNRGCGKCLAAALSSDNARNLIDAHELLCSRCGVGSGAFAVLRDKFHETTIN